VKIIAREKTENCFKGNFEFKYVFDTLWTKNTIHALEIFGQLKYYESFPRPMFQLTCTCGSFIKGIQDTNECRIIYNRDKLELMKRFEKQLEEIINSF